MDYPEVVKNPRDLGSIQQKLQNDEYTSVEEVAKDIRLVWSNCMLYNRDGSDLYHLADKFGQSFEEAYTAYQKLHNTSGDKGRLPSMDERMTLSHDIFKIDNSEMAHAIGLIEKHCPSAIARRADEVILNFDAMSAECFHSLNEYVLGCQIDNGSAGKKRKKLG